VLLVEKNGLLEPFAQASLGNLLADVRGLAVVSLSLEDRKLALALVLRDVVLGHPSGAHRGHVDRDVAGELEEFLVAGDEVRLAVDLDESADSPVEVDVVPDRALGRFALAALGRLRLALHAKELDRLGNVALGLLERALALHHARARLVAKRLDVLR